MSVPLDEDGFLRRECPTCEREFKWLPSADGTGEPPMPGGYFCPYCGIQAPADTFLTKAQAERATNIALREFVVPQIKEFEHNLKRMSRNSLVRMELHVDEPAPMDELYEPDDMVRVDFACHPAEPVKVLEDWVGGAYCLICGAIGGGA